MTLLKKRNWFGLVLLLAATQTVNAEDLADRIDASLSLRSDVWSGSRQLDGEQGIAQIGVWGRAKLDLDTAGTVAASGWLTDRSGQDAGMSHRRVRELYWRYRNGPAELKIGRQMVVWGRADGLNPTDNLSPRDFTLLAPEDGDLRYGNEAVQLAVDTTIGNFSGLFFPRAASHTIPLEPLPNVLYSVEKPSGRSQWALKWDASGEGVDGSLSYFHGVDPMPDLSLKTVGPAGVAITVSNHPVSILGADLSMTHRGVVWRAEMAWMRTDSVGKNDFTHKKPQIWLVAGGEWNLGNSTTLGIQGTLLHVMDFQNPDDIADPIFRQVAQRQVRVSNQSAVTQSGITWRLARNWWNDTLLIETSGVLLWTSGSGVWRTKIAYALTDHWQLQAGTDYYFGPDTTFFGQLRKNRLLYVQARLNW